MHSNYCYWASHQPTFFGHRCSWGLAKAVSWRWSMWGCPKRRTWKMSRCPQRAWKSAGRCAFREWSIVAGPCTVRGMMAKDGGTSRAHPSWVFIPAHNVKMRDPPLSHLQMWKYAIRVSHFHIVGAAQNCENVQTRMRILICTFDHVL